ncbi:MAG TPA: hypothetical protein VL986_04285, partial [Terracidiphilus sp.]|nr:hypothetical protein [Terracidiphilus sp.]
YARCWCAWYLIRRIAIDVMDSSLEFLLLRKLLSTSNNPLLRNLVTAFAGAVAFTDFRMQALF